MPRKTRFVRTLRQHPDAEHEIVDVFLLTALGASVSSRGDRYLRLTLEDRTGSIEAFVWDDVHLYENAARPGDVVEVCGRLRAHRGRPQIHLSWLRRLEEPEVAEIDPADLRPGLDRATRERLWKRIEAIVSQVKEPHIRRLLDGYLEDREFREAFGAARAAKSFHHAYDGGLLEHTATLLELARSVAQVYGDRLNRDLLVAGAFLHDVAKVAEMDARTGEYTDAGRLLGHIAMGIGMLDERMRKLPGFPESLRLHLMHMILSHHERADWGSPVKPQTLEALVLHYLDLLDARVGGACAWIEQEGVEPGEWTSFWRGGETPLQRTPQFDEASPRIPSMREIRKLEEEMLEAEREGDGQEPREQGDGDKSEAPRRPGRGGRQEALF